MSNKPISKSQQENFIRKEFDNFSKFLSKYSIFALAVGTILGQTSKDVVNKLVSGIISPAIALVMPEGKFKEWSISVQGSTFLLGEFFDSLLQMVLTMIIIYIVARYIFRNSEVIGIKKNENDK